jgi:hypothetical protein
LGCSFGNIFKNASGHPGSEVLKYADRLNRVRGLTNKVARWYIFQPKKSLFGEILGGLAMKYVGTFYGYLFYFTANWYIVWTLDIHILRLFGTFFAIFVYSTKKNLATLLSNCEDSLTTSRFPFRAFLCTFRDNVNVIMTHKTPFCLFLLKCIAELPDFSWYNLPKCEKIY